MEAGALTGLVSRYHAIGQFTAYKAEQILVNKVSPAKIPVETLTRFALQVRMDVAEQNARTCILNYRLASKSIRQQETASCQSLP